jgi:hypothetical protein
MNSTGHFGIAQWDANRQAELGGSTDFNTQLEYIWKEWHDKEAAAFASITGATTPEGSASAMEGYERGGDYGGRSLHASRCRHCGITSRRVKAGISDDGRVAW